jgi:hypothetical protein
MRPLFKNAADTLKRVIVKAKPYRKLIVGTSTLLIVALVVQTAFFNDVPEAQAALTTIRQEVNITNGYLSAASSAYATSSEVVSIDPSKYNGATYYLEVVASTTAATNATVSLVNAATGAVARSVTINGTAYDRYRSTSFTPGATTEYRVRLNNEAVGKGIIAARIVILQNNNPISTTQTQIEIGNKQTYTSGTLSPLSAPKYWKYNSANWDGSPTFYAEATYARTIDTTVASSTTYTTSGSRSFTVPSNVASTTVVQLWGGGGGGGAASTNTTGSGSGGAGGQYSRSVIGSLAGLTKTVAVALGGPGGVSTVAGTVGGDSTWDATVVVAKGGAGGAINSGAGGVGATTNGVGNTVRAGGSGAAGTSGGISGGGGEGACSTQTGTSATTGTGGANACDGGNGADGRTTNGTGATGNAPGGGGAGGRSTGNPNADGGAGAIGRAVISYNLNVSATTTIVLQESDGTGDGFAGWTDKITIVSGGSASTPTRVRSSSFTPVNGRNYRIAVREGYNGATHAIYNAKIIVDQASSPTKLEAQYLLANRTLFAGTALQKYHTYWDSAEWTNSANTYTHQVDSADGSTSVVEIDTEAGTLVTGSVVTSPDNAGVSSSMTMPATGDLDVKATTNNGNVYASKILVAVTPDVTAPTPNPYFTTAPNATTTNMVNMTSVTITDLNVVSYYFNPVVGSCGGNTGTGTTTSGWQSSPIYYDTGLQTNKCYAYTVTGKDAANNTTATSTASTTYTRAAVPGVVTYSNIGVTSLEITNDANGNPSLDPVTNFAVRASSTDSRWNNKWLTDAGSGVVGTSTSPNWMSDATIDNLVALANLYPSTRYDFEVVARNQNQVLTATSTRTGTTTLPDTSPPSPSTASFSSAPNNDSINAISMTATVGTDVSTPIQYQFAYNATGCAANNGGDGATRTWSTSNSYTNSPLSTNKCYSYTVQMRDALSNTGTASAEVDVYTSAAVPSAPTLSAAGETTFEIDNNANSNPTNTEFAAMVTSSDNDWNNKYIKSDGTPSVTKEWLSDATLDSVIVTALDFATLYTIKVMARNGDNEETASSSTSNITTTTDGTAPATPSFSSLPNNDSASQISMTTNVVSDPSGPVQYFFDAVAGSCGTHLGANGSDSVWQTGLSYSDDGLETNECYAYTVAARDANTNTSGASAASQAYTSANTPGLVTSSAVTDTTINILLNENGNPTGVGGAPNTDFAILVTSSDNNWNNKYVDASGNYNASTQWLTNSQIDSLVVQGLLPNTTYTFSAKAINEDNDETSFSSTNNISTVPTEYPETRIQGGTRLQGVRVQ